MANQSTRQIPKHRRLRDQRPRRRGRRLVRPYQRDAARAAGPAAADLHARSVGVGSASAAWRRSTCRTRSSSPGRSARCSRSSATARPTPLDASSARSRRSDAAALERPVAVAGQRPLPPADGLRRLQPDLRRVSTRARPRIAWATDAGRRRAAAAGACGRSGSRAATPVTAARPATCRSATSRRRPRRRLHAARRPDLPPRSATTSSRTRPRTRCSTGCARRSWIRSNVDVPAFHEALLRSGRAVPALHLCRRRRARHPRVARRRSRAASLLTDLAREFGYARSQDGQGRRAAIRRRRGRHRGVRLRHAAAADGSRRDRAAGLRSEAGAAHARHRCWSRRCSRRSRRSSSARRERYYRIAGLDPQNLGRRGAQRRAGQGHRAGGSDVAGQFLDICIRAIDYCPPADMELGEYLRAIITADGDLERSDKWGFREALMRSFRRREIFPEHVPLHDRGRGAVAAARRRAAHSGPRVPAS